MRGGETFEEKWEDYQENGLTATISVGFSASVNLGVFNISGSFEFAFDLKGNIQFVGSGSYDVTSSGSLSASAGITGSVYAMPDTSYLAGDTYYTGASIYVPNPAGVGSAGVSGNVGRTSDGYWGVNGGIGVGTTSAAGADVHAGYSRTKALTKQVNIFDSFAKLLN